MSPHSTRTWSPSRPELAAEGGLGHAHALVGAVHGRAPRSRDRSRRRTPRHSIGTFWWRCTLRLARHDAVGLGEGGFDVAVHVGARGRRRCWSRGRRRSACCRDRGPGRRWPPDRQVVVVDLDQLERVLGDVAALGHDDGDRVADEADLVGAQQGEGDRRRPERCPWGERRVDRSACMPAAVVDGHDAGQLFGGARCRCR